MFPNLRTHFFWGVSLYRSHPHGVTTRKILILSNISVRITTLPHFLTSYDILQGHYLWGTVFDQLNICGIGSNTTLSLGLYSTKSEYGLLKG